MEHIDPEDLATRSGLSTTYTSMSTEEAAELACRRFGIENLLAVRFATEKDDTFRIDAADGAKYVLKIANPGESRDEIEFQISLLSHIAVTDPSIPVPRVIYDRHGRQHFSVVDRAGQSRFVRMLSFLDGTPLDSTTENSLERFRIGEMLGRLRHATSKFSHAADTRALAWDVKHLMCLRHLLPHIDDAAKQRQLEVGLERFAKIQDRIPRLRVQVLHNDFSRSNLIVDHDHAEFVTGIIDFGDTVRTAVAIDVATALMNHLPRCDAAVDDKEFFSDAREVLHGYLSVADLTDDELKFVPYLVMGRVIARALITHWRARMFPSNSVYILRNTTHGWSQLQWFLQYSDGELFKLLP